MKKCKGRPTIMTEITLKKLEEAFLLGCSDKEACFIAGISHQTLYDYQKKSKHFVERKELLKQSPTYIARKRVVESLSEEPELALKYLKCKARDEFAEKVVNEDTGNKEGLDKIASALKDLAKNE